MFLRKLTPLPLPDQACGVSPKEVKSLSQPIRGGWVPSGSTSQPLFNWTCPMPSPGTAIWANEMVAHEPSRCHHSQSWK